MTISVVNNKGGVGKTTSTQNLGAAFQKFANARVLFIDLDGQASLTRCFGILETQVGKNHVGNYLSGELPFESVVINTPIGDLLPSAAELNTKEDVIKASPVFPFNLKLLLEKIKKNYDYIMIDCPPTLSGMTRIALIACDLYMVPLQAEYLSYEGLRNFLSYSSELQLISPQTKLGGVFATRYNPRINKKLSNEIIEATKQQLGDSFFSTTIRDNIAISEAQASGQDIFSYAPDSNGAMDYYKLTKEILDSFNANN
ncbi:ParA family protein [Emticicia sp. TH156]|uniref:ParA family protein n=1 Tax=Emticicia sp. TH156 TaxID=2067454 RepID=UPI000C75E6A6|nr:ParA family protein [Emticicia sp. TH156]PLK44554.1 ParA family protein [Emticicia sp. TH156]